MDTAENTDSTDVEQTDAEQATDTGTTDNPVNTPEESDDPAETFSRAYVVKLRDENAKLRVRAQRADELAHRLHRALVDQTGRLADSADVEFDPEHLEDAAKLNTAIDELLTAKPHLRSRTPKGDVGQGTRGIAEEPVNLLGILKNLV